MRSMCIEVWSLDENMGFIATVYILLRFTLGEFPDDVTTTCKQPRWRTVGTLDRSSNIRQDLLEMRVHLIEIQFNLL